MRISTMQQYNINISRMQNSQNTIGELQRQISTGKSYHQPSDMPAVAAESIRLERDIAALERYEGNIKVATNRLRLQEEMLSDMNTRYDRLSELVLSVDGGENDANLKVIASEIRVIVDSLAGGMNKKDAQGEYIFAGSKGHTQPYELGTDGRWHYQGDNGQREIQVGATHYIESNDSGQFLFESVPGELEFSHTGSSNVVFKSLTDTTDDLSFANDDRQKQFEKFLKDDVRGNLEMATYPTPGGGGTFTFEIRDSAGTLHYSDDTLAALPSTVSFKGADIAVKPFNTLTATDFEPFVSGGTLNGVEHIDIADKTTMDQFFADQGDVTLELYEGSDTYKLFSAKTGAYIDRGGVTSWSIPADGIIREGGLELKVEKPVTGTPSQLPSVPAVPPVNENHHQFKLSAPDPAKPGSDVTSVTRTTPVIAANVVSATDLQAFVQGLPAGTASLGFEVTGAATAASAGPPPVAAVNGAYSITAYDAAGAPLGAAIAGGQIAAGTPFVIDGATGIATGVQFELSEAGEGDSFTVPMDSLKAESTVGVDYEVKNILNVALEFAEQLEQGRSTPERKKALEELQAQTITDIQIAQDRVNEGITAAGSRVSSLDDTLTANGDIMLFTKTTLSNIQDADLAEVASKFKLEQTLLQASQQTFASVSRMSLFDYIN